MIDFDLLVKKLKLKQSIWWTRLWYGDPDDQPRIMARRPGRSVLISLRTDEYLAYQRTGDARAHLKAKKTKGERFKDRAALIREAVKMSVKETVEGIVEGTTVDKVATISVDQEAEEAEEENVVDGVISSGNIDGDIYEVIDAASTAKELKATSSSAPLSEVLHIQEFINKILEFKEKLARYTRSSAPLLVHSAPEMDTYPVTNRLCPQEQLSAAQVQELFKENTSRYHLDVLHGQNDYTVSPMTDTLVQALKAPIGMPQQPPIAFLKERDMNQQQPRDLVGRRLRIPVNRVNTPLRMNLPHLSEAYGETGPLPPSKGSYLDGILRQYGAE